jgi:hypothetical protein
MNRTVHVCRYRLPITERAMREAVSFGGPIVNALSHIFAGSLRSSGRRGCLSAVSRRHDIVEVLFATAAGSGDMG